MLIFHGPLLGIDMLFLLMRWIQYIRKPRVQLLSAVCLLSVLVLLDGFNPVNNAIVISQTICCFGFAACMHACLVLGYKSKCSCMPRQELFRILTAASDARVIKHPQCSCLHRRGFKMGPVSNLRRRKAFSLQNHLCYIHVKCVFECLSTGGRTAAQVAALSSPLPHRAQRQAHNPLGQGPYRSQPTETCATPAT